MKNQKLYQKGCLNLLNNLCKRCNRKLRAIKSQEIGYGPQCAKIDNIIISNKIFKEVQTLPNHILDDFVEGGKENEDKQTN